MIEKLDVTVVIRSSGERTEALCQYVLESQVPKERIFLVREKPFWKAVQRTFEIGKSEGRTWTLAIDADVLIRKDGIERMIENARKFSLPLFCYQGYVMDFVFGRPRGGGPHLYNTKYLPQALDFLSSDNQVLRPESDTYKSLALQNIYTIIDSKIFGVHDYFQSINDYYRKGYFHAVKHDSFDVNARFINYWVSSLQGSNSIESIISGWLEGKRRMDIEVDIDFFKQVRLGFDADERGLIESEFQSCIDFVESECQSQDDKKLFYKTMPFIKKGLFRTLFKKSGRWFIKLGGMLDEKSGY